MLREPKRARRYNEPIILLKAAASFDDYSHIALAAPVEVGKAYAYVRQMSATKTALTFQLADVIGLEIEMRAPGVEFNMIRYRGHDVYFSQPEDINGRGMVLKIQGYYQQNNP